MKKINWYGRSNLFVHLSIGYLQSSIDINGTFNIQRNLTLTHNYIQIRMFDISTKHRYTPSRLLLCNAQPNFPLNINFSQTQHFCNSTILMPFRNQPFCPLRFFIIFTRYHNFYSCCGPIWFRPIDCNVQKKNLRVHQN